MGVPVPDSVDYILLDEATIQDRVQEMADESITNYHGIRNEDFLLVSVLKGSFIFLADLARRLTVPHRVDFIALSSYADQAEATGAVRLIMDTRADVTGRPSLIVEDILDAGYTLRYLYRLFGAREPASLRTAVLLSKPDRHKVEVPLDYTRFSRSPMCGWLGMALTLQIAFERCPTLPH